MTFYKKLRTSVAGVALLSAGLVATTAMADFVINDDLIVDGSTCIGFDCVDGESFGSDTLRLKENNLRIHFDDTSISASFPRRDWRIIINDQANGGAEYFGIQDATAGRQPFRIEGGAPASSLYVEDSGDIGIGTATPVTDLHVVSGNTPTLRLEQNGSSGFTPQTYDVAANEANFFIRDVTNSSRLVFKVKPGAPTSSIFIAADGDIGLQTESPSGPLHVGTTTENHLVVLDGGNVGMGTNAPDAPLHVVDAAGSGGEVMLHLQNNGNPEILLNNTNNGNTWNVGGGNNFVIKHGGGTTPSTLSSTGDLTLTGTITTTGSCMVGCDEVFDEDYDLPSMEEQAELMYANSYLPNVGPTASGPIDMTQKMIGMLNELEKAHIYISQLNAENAELKARMENIEKQLQQ